MDSSTLTASSSWNWWKSYWNHSVLRDIFDIFTGIENDFSVLLPWNLCAFDPSLLGMAAVCHRFCRCHENSSQLQVQFRHSLELLCPIFVFRIKQKKIVFLHLSPKHFFKINFHYENQKWKEIIFPPLMELSRDSQTFPFPVNNQNRVTLCRLQYSSRHSVDYQW